MIKPRTETTDFYKACYLMCLGHRVEVHWEPTGSHATFVIDPPFTTEESDAFDDSHTIVKMCSFIHNIKLLKQVLYRSKPKYHIATSVKKKFRMCLIHNLITSTT